MRAQRVWSRRVGLNDGGAPSERLDGRRTVRSGKPAWAAETDRLWTNLLQELAVAEPGEIPVQGLDEVGDLEQAS